MSTNPLRPGLGISFHDDNWHAAIVTPSTVRLQREGEPLPLYVRDHWGKMLPNETVGHVVGRIMDKYAGFKPERVGVSTHDHNLDSHNWHSFAGTQVEAVDPTAATLMGLEHVRRNSDRMLIRPGKGKVADRQGLLKIGPDSVTWIVDGETESHELTVDIIRRFCIAAEDFASSMNATSHTNPVQLLGNWGWVNAARHLALKGPEHPGMTTSKLLEAAKNGDRKSRRQLVAHLCWLAPRIDFMDRNNEAGEPFAVRVADLMVLLVGHASGYVASQQPLSKLYVQCNAISSSDEMKKWCNQRLAWAISRGRSNLSTMPDVILVEPKPQIAEAYGAILLAEQNVGVSV